MLFVNNQKLLGNRKRFEIIKVFFVLQILILLTLILYVPAVNAPPPSSGLTWTITEVVSTESTMNSVVPSLAVGSDGTVHIAWCDYTDYGGSGSDEDIFYKKYVLGSGWTVTEVVSTESTMNSIVPSLGVGSDGTVHVAWMDWTSYGGSGGDIDIFYKKFVPGSGWTATEVVSTESVDDSRGPCLAVHSDGSIHIAWFDETDYGGCGTDNDIFYKKYVPGSGWSATDVVSTESTWSSGSPSLAVGFDGIVHIAWEEYVNSHPDIFHKKFVPGSGWTTSEDVSTPSTKDSLRASLAVESDGTVHIAWCSGYVDIYSFAAPEICYRRYVPGSGWTTLEEISTDITGDFFSPSLAVGSDGIVHIAWYGGNRMDVIHHNEWISSDIFYKKFVPGSGWTTSEEVSTESIDLSFWPFLGVVMDGTVHIAWYDETDYGGCGTDNDIFYKSASARSAYADVFVQHTYQGDLVVDIGVGDPSSPVWSQNIWNRAGGGTANLDLTVDLSSAVAYLPPDGNQWFLRVYDGAGGDVGQITEFSITYDGSTYTCTETPVPVADYQTSYVYIPSGPAPPEAYADVFVQHTYQGDLFVDIGVGDPSSPVWSQNIWNRAGGGTDNLDLTVDLSSAMAYLPPDGNQWYLKVYDGAGGDVGQITQFSITYDGTTYTSTDVPVLISDMQTSYAYIPS